MLGVTTHPQRRGETAVNATLSCPCAGRQAVPAGAGEDRRGLTGVRGEVYRCVKRRAGAVVAVGGAGLGGGRGGAAARLGGGAAAAGVAGRADPAGRGRLELAAAGRGGQPGPDVLPREGGGAGTQGRPSRGG